ncbi:MAG TPA: FAD-binding oxidoreductase [Pirellulales bacterium]|jgi:FAD/FMN-containing dehydrogenase
MKGASDANSRKLRYRLALTAVAIVSVMAFVVGRPAYLWSWAWLRDRPVAEQLDDGEADDASRLNRTPVSKVWSIPSDPSGAESQLRELLTRARRDHLGVAIAGARHSMGGHTICPDGIVLDMLPFDRMQLDAERRTIRVGAGARWAAVVPYLDTHGLSVGVMQSNNNFTVGGSVSVNCHGWQHDQPPIASTVESFRLMRANGAVVNCSRTENAELFSLVLGGYGLFGVILEVELRVVANERYTPEVERFSAEQYPERFAKLMGEAKDIGMAYGRLCVVPGNDTLLREAVLVVFRRAPCTPQEVPVLSPLEFAGLRRQIHRAQIDSPAGKRLRWQVESSIGEFVRNQYVSRNQLLNEDADVYREQNSDRVDILQEYFVPAEGFSRFLADARRIITRHEGDLLNVTVRTIRCDPDSFLRYADQDMFSLVMLFNHARTATADEQVQGMTREMIDAVLASGGRFYLPYRLHATATQLRAAYPQVEAFFELKRKYDPEEIFQNQFYTTYATP